MMEEATKKSKENRYRKWELQVILEHCSYPEGKYCKLDHFDYKLGEGKEIKVPFIQCSEKATPLEKLHDLIEMEEKNDQDIKLLRQELANLIKQQVLLELEVNSITTIDEAESNKADLRALQGMIDLNYRTIKEKEDYGITLSLELREAKGYGRIRHSVSW